MRSFGGSAGGGERGGRTGKKRTRGSQDSRMTNLEGSKPVLGVDFIKKEMKTVATRRRTKKEHMCLFKQNFFSRSELKGQELKGGQFPVISSKKGKKKQKGEGTNTLEPSERPLRFVLNKHFGLKKPHKNPKGSQERKKRTGPKKRGGIFGAKAAQGPLGTNTRKLWGRQPWGQFGKQGQAGALHLQKRAEG